jgi:hypothetical protein
MATPLSEEEIERLMRDGSFYDFVRNSDERGIMHYRTLENLTKVFGTALREKHTNLTRTLSRIPSDIKIEAPPEYIDKAMDYDNFYPEILSRFVNLNKDHIIKHIAREGNYGIFDFPEHLLKSPEVRQALMDPSIIGKSGSAFEDMTRTAHAVKDMSYDEARDFVQGVLDTDLVKPYQLSYILPPPYEGDRSHNYIRAVFNHALKHGEDFGTLHGHNHDDIGRLAAEALKEGGWSEGERKYLINHAINYGQIGAVSGEELSKHIQAIKDSGESLYGLARPLTNALKEGKIPKETLDSLHSALSNDPDEAHWWYPLHGENPDVEFTAEDANKFFESNKRARGNVMSRSRIPIGIMQGLDKQGVEDLIQSIDDPYEPDKLNDDEKAYLRLLWHSTNSKGEKLDLKTKKKSLEDVGETMEMSKKLRNSGRFRDLFDSPQEFQKVVESISNSDPDVPLLDVITHPMAGSKLISRLYELGNIFEAKDDIEYDTLDGGTETYNDSSRLSRMLDLSNPSKTVMSGYGLPTKVKVGSAALRQLRDHLEKEGRSFRPEELPKDRTWNSIVKEIRDRKGNVNYVTDWNPLRDASGKIAHDKVSSYIDSMPETSLNIVDDHIWNHGLQNHTDKPHNILMHNITPETADKLKSEGLWDSFIRMGDHEDHNPAHPSSPWTLGWTRYHIDHKKKQIFIEEHQSDMYSYFRDHMGGTELNDKQKEKMQRAYSMTFGDVHPSELLHESAMQYFRDNGFHDYEVQIHSVPSKAKMALDTSRDPPAHFDKTYNKTPKKAGAVPSTYGSMKMQDGAGAPSLMGMPTHSHQVRKFEDILLDIAKGEW